MLCFEVMAIKQRYKARAIAMLLNFKLSISLFNAGWLAFTVLRL
jgi:hypothetical protein